MYITNSTLAWEFSKLQRPNIHIYFLQSTATFTGITFHLPPMPTASIHVLPKQVHSYSIEPHPAPLQGLYSTLEHCYSEVSGSLLRYALWVYMWKHGLEMFAHIYVRGMLQKITGQAKVYRRKRCSDTPSNVRVAETYSTIKHRSQVQAWSLLLSRAEICRIRRIILTTQFE